MYKPKDIIWKSKTYHVDIDTGEEITQAKINKENYIIIKTKKHVEYNEHKTRGYIEYTKQYRKHPQLSIFNK